MSSNDRGSAIEPAPTVIALHQAPADGLLTKKELAAHLRRSERWIELRQRDSGLPVADTDRFGRRRYCLADVDAWLHEHSKPRTAAERISELEVKVWRLEAAVKKLMEGAR